MGVPGKGAALEFSCLPSSFEAFKVFHILISAQLLATSSRAKRPVSYADVLVVIQLPRFDLAERIAQVSETGWRSRTYLVTCR